MVFLSIFAPPCLRFGVVDIRPGCFTRLMQTVGLFRFVSRLIAALLGFSLLCVLMDLFGLEEH